MEYDFPAFTKDVLDDAYKLSIGGFKERVFHHIRRLVHVDSGRWLTRTSAEAPYHDAGMYLYNLPQERDSLLREKYHSLDILYKAISENQGVAINLASLMEDNEWFSSELYKKMCEDYGINRAISIIVPCSHSGVFNGFGFYRKDRQNRFTEEERQTLENVAHFISRVLRLCLFSNLASDNSSVKNCAIYDHLGELLDSTPLFVDRLNILMRTDSTSLPADWFESKDSAVFKKLGVAKFIIKPLSDLYLVILENKTVFDSFTPLQNQVAELIVDGKSNKEIALELGISVYTVADHAKDIAAKLGGFGQGTTGRAKLVSRLLHTTE